MEGVYECRKEGENVRMKRGECVLCDVDGEWVLCGDDSDDDSGVNSSDSDVGIDCC